MGHDYAAPMSRVFSSQCPHSSSNSTTPFQISIPSEIEGIEKKNDKKTIRRKFQGNCYLLNPHSINRIFPLLILLVNTGRNISLVYIKKITVKIEKNKKKINNTITYKYISIN
jgi:hypothetical protein